MMTLTSSNYYTPEANREYWSVSLFKAFDKCEASGLAQARGQYEREETDALLIGSYVDAYFTGDLDEFGLTPMSALPLLTDALHRGHADAFWTEEGLDAVELLLDDFTLARVWFDAEGLPCRAEIQCGERVTVSCEIKNWSMH